MIKTSTFFYIDLKFNREIKFVLRNSFRWSMTVIMSNVGRMQRVATINILIKLPFLGNIQLVQNSSYQFV